MSNDEEDRQELERWLAAQPSPPNIFDALASRQPGVIRAYLTRAFREAAAQVVEERERVARVRAFAVEAFGGNAQRAEDFLRSAHPSLADTPLRVAVQSHEGAEEVITLLREHVNERD